MREAIVSRSPRTGAILLWSFDGEVPADGAVSVVELQRQVLLAFFAPRIGLPRGQYLAQGAVGAEAWCPRRPRSENPF